MRNLRAELQGQDDVWVVEWKPAEDNVLVGYIRETGVDALVVQEERTGVLVRVSLSSPDLAALFEKHSPRLHDKIGIKCIAIDPDGTGRFAMVLDREYTIAEEPDGPSVDSFASTSSGLDDCSVSAQERDFIQQMLEATLAVPASHIIRDRPDAIDNAKVHRISSPEPRRAEIDDRTELPDWLKAMVTRSRWKPVEYAPANSVRPSPLSRLLGR